MRIIRHGSVKPSERTNTCLNCGCVFTTLKAEEIVSIGKGLLEEGIYVDCPECGARTRVTDTVHSCGSCRFCSEDDKYLCSKYDINTSRTNFVCPEYIYNQKRSGWY